MELFALARIRGFLFFFQCGSYRRRQVCLGARRNFLTATFVRTWPIRHLMGDLGISPGTNTSLLLVLLSVHLHSQPMTVWKWNCLDTFLGTVSDLWRYFQAIKLQLKSRIIFLVNWEFNAQLQNAQMIVKNHIIPIKQSALCAKIIDMTIRHALWITTPRMFPLHTENNYRAH